MGGKVQNQPLPGLHYHPSNALHRLRIIKVTVTPHYLGTLPFEHKLLRLR